MVLNLGVSGQGTERDMAICDFNSPQFLQIPDVEVVLVRQLAGFKQNHQVSSAGEGFPLAGLAREHFKDFAEIGGRDQLVGWNVGSHWDSCWRDLDFASLRR